MKKNILISVVASLIAIPRIISCNQHDQSCNTIKNHYRQYVHENTNISDYSNKTVYEILSELEIEVIDGVETYKFKGLDYKTDWSRSSWAAAGHLSKALKIAILAEDRNSNELRDIAKKLTYHWVFSNYHNINWWQNELGANSTLANLGLYTFDYLGKKGQDAFNGKIRESSIKWRPSVGSHTGANVFDYIDITCRNAAINNDKEEMDIAFNRLAQEITNENTEGFQKDGSFFQHGRQVQNVSYGKSIIRVAKTMHQFINTSYHMPDEKMKILSDYVSKGLGASIFKGYTNYTTVSREYSRENNLDTQANGFKDLAFFCDIDNYPSKEETKVFVDSLKDRKNPIAKDTIIYFPIAKMIVANIGHSKGDGIYISYKATEPKLVNTECVNGENQLGMNLSYGTNTCVMDKGTEYFNIAPVMDYDSMPGATAVKYYQNAPSSEHWKDADDVIKRYSAIYGDPLYGAPVAEIDSDGNKYIFNDGQIDGVTFSMTKTKHHNRGEYTVTCFATTDGVVLVGSNFNYNVRTGDPQGFNEAMYTTVDQYITDDGETITTTNNSFRNHSNGNVLYTSLDNNRQLKKTVQKRTYEAKDWRRNNRDSKSTSSGEKNVATIELVGSNLQQPNGYAYAIEPYIDGQSKFKSAFNDRSEGIHAIELPDGRIVAAFYDKTHLSFQDIHGITHSIEEKDFIDGKGAFKIFDKQ